MDDACSCQAQRSAHHSNKLKQNIIHRLNRIEGQVRGLRQMIENDVYCDEVLTQIAAVRSALSAVSQQLFEAHLKSCITRQIKEGHPQIMDELLETIRRMMK